MNKDRSSQKSDEAYNVFKGSSAFSSVADAEKVEFEDGIPQINKEPERREQPMEQQPPPQPNHAQPNHAQPQHAQPQQPQPSPQAHFEEAIKQQAKKDVLVQSHPLLSMLHEKFSLKKAKKYSIDVWSSDEVKFNFTMTRIPEELTIWAVSEAKGKFLLQGEEAATVRLQLLIVSASIVAINGEPIWKVLNIEPLNQESSDLIKDPLDLSVRMRKIVSETFADLLFSTLQGIGEKLWEFYDNRLIPDSSVSSSMDKEDKERHICPIDGCNHYLIEERRLDKGGEVEPYFCKFHGTELVEVEAISEAQAAMDPLA